MSLTSRFFGIALLAVFGSLSVNSQTPAPKSAPAAARASLSTESNSGVAMIQNLLASFGRYDQDGRPAGQKLGFEIPEKALNDYIAYALTVRPRPGITAMTVSLLPNNQVSSDVEVDFDAVQKWDPTIFPELLRGLLAGRRTVHADVTFESKNGTYTFQLKDAKGADGKAMMTKMMSGVIQALGSRQPESYDTAKPIPLPFGLKRVWTGKQLLCGEN
jgi:hypothetical protein